jgi:hypothetical protein
MVKVQHSPSLSNQILSKPAKIVKPRVTPDPDDSFLKSKQKSPKKIPKSKETTPSIQEELFPCGVLSIDQIMKGKRVLEKIKTTSNENEILKLTNEFYTTIPYSNKRRKLPVIKGSVLEAQQERIIQMINFVKK